MTKSRLKIYKSRVHLALTLFLVIAPFIFLLFFAKIEQIATTTLFAATFSSIYRVVIAYFISAGLAWTFAVILHKGKPAIIGIPIFDVLQSVPSFAALPIAVLYWGSSDFIVIFFLVLAIIWPLFFSILSSLKLIRHDWEEAAEITGLHGFNYLRYFLLPISMPGLITGSIVGLGEGWEALVATEIIVGTKIGFGNFFQSFSHNLNTTAFGILGLLIIVFSINKLIWLPLFEWSHRLLEE